MKIELKNIKTNKRLSQETNAYSADIIVDGKKAGTVMNHGTGGPDFIEPAELAARISAYAKTLPPYTYYGKEFEHSADTLLADIFADATAKQDLTKLMKTKVVFIRNKHCYTSKVRPIDNAIILNDLAFDEALKLFKEYTK